MLHSLLRKDQSPEILRLSVLWNYPQTRLRSRLLLRLLHSRQRHSHTSTASFLAFSGRQETRATNAAATLITSSVHFQGYEHTIFLIRVIYALRRHGHNHLSIASADSRMLSTFIYKRTIILTTTICIIHCYVRVMLVLCRSISITASVFLDISKALWRQRVIDLICKLSSIAAR